MISGALDDNQNEFDSITDCGSSLAPIETAPANFNKKTTRTRKSGNVKLRFHHQALPQEYLEHYEASQNQFHTKEMTIGSLSGNVRTSKKDRSATSTLPSPSGDHAEQEPQDAKPEKFRQMWQQSKTSKPQNGKDSRAESESQQPKTVQKQTTRLTAQDLPYMGEITLDNFKPRRGRKPKKADICHLIYKNYGTVVPDQRTDDLDVELAASNNSAAMNHSLLEKRLTESTADDQDEQLNNTKTKDGTEEPLNLCVRDRYDCDVLTVISDDDATDSEKLSEFRSEMLSVNNQISNANFSRNLKMALPNFQLAHLDNKNELPETGMDMINSDVDLNNYNCWQNSGMFINPMVLYLQKIANANSNTNASASTFGRNSIEPPKTNSIDSTSDINASRTRQKRMLVPKKMSQLLKEDVINSNSSTISASAVNTKPKATAQSNQKNIHAPKRKRSAIFIPPVPEESSTNHATEVSICKFKFTGGAKPSLQEKKMLSVDAGGNFRYYSGTGDKSIRGYEFFPRESLKQSSLMSASSAGAFLNTPGQKITNDVPPPSFGISNELLQIPEVSTPSSVGILPSNSMVQHQLQHPKQQLYHNSRKRKSKRSMQREKLEKTFKEKGFLIQTQQLEQAEGTYCKFRQVIEYIQLDFN